MRLLGIPRLLVDLGRIRRDLGVADRADNLAYRLVLLGQREQGEVTHGRTSRQLLAAKAI